MNTRHLIGIAVVMGASTRETPTKLNKNEQRIVTNTKQIILEKLSKKNSVV